MTKKLMSLGLVALVGTLASVGWAGPNRPTPSDKRGNPMQVVSYDWTRKTASAESVICTGRCLLGGVIMGTAPQLSWLQIRDTSVANGTGAIFAKIPFSTAPQNNVFAWPQQPTLFTYGISAQFNLITSGEEVTVLYLDLDDQ
jgi:hypothetical protein